MSCNCSYSEFYGGLCQECRQEVVVIDVEADVARLIDGAVVMEEEWSDADAADDYYRHRIAALTTELSRVLQRLLATRSTTGSAEGKLYRALLDFKRASV